MAYYDILYFIEFMRFEKQPVMRQQAKLNLIVPEVEMTFFHLHHNRKKITAVIPFVAICYYNSCLNLYLETLAAEVLHCLLMSYFLHFEENNCTKCVCINICTVGMHNCIRYALCIQTSRRKFMNVSCYIHAFAIKK